jgi:ADP-ribosylglycohydrolase
MDKRDRYLGALVGLAVGDALGTTLEFTRPGSFEPITDMVGGGPFRLQPGEWTDDTSMALCLARSLVEQQRFDPTDQMRRYLEWYKHGYLASNGRCFDIGTTVQRALRTFERTGDPFSGSVDPQTAGNGSLMRLAPVPMMFLANPALAIEHSDDMSRTTHAAPEAVDACRFYAGLLIGALSGVTKADLLSPLFTPVDGLWDREPLTPGVQHVACGSYVDKKPPAIRGSGYVKESLEAALWAFANHDTFAECVLAAVNLGDDADTTAAICGQLAGAHYGIEAVPTAWRQRIAMSELIEATADELHDAASAMQVPHAAKSN